MTAAFAHDAPAVRDNGGRLSVPIGLLKGAEPVVRVYPQRFALMRGRARQSFASSPVLPTPRFAARRRRVGVPKQTALARQSRRGNGRRVESWETAAAGKGRSIPRLRIGLSRPEVRALPSA